MEKYINLNTIPKKGNCFDWKHSIGKKVDFKYGDICGVFTIKNTIPNGKHTKLEIIYLSNSYIVNINHFCKCNIQNIVGKPKPLFKYEINTIIDNLTLIDRKYENKTYKNGPVTLKYYKYKCNICGFEKWVKESYLGKIGCSCCGGKTVLKGFNDIATTHPTFIKFFADKKDATKVSHGSEKIIKCKCPLCKAIKFLQAKDLIRNGLGCTCGDGFSYPEKIFTSILLQLKIKFIAQYSPSWASKKRYDFFLSDYNIIVEIQGEQHYRESWIGLGESLNIIQSNDEFKKQLAFKNNVTNYIQLDCKISSLAYIKDSILNSELSKILMIDNINWTNCDYYAFKNKILDVCSLWNKYHSVTTILAKIETINSRTTIIKYLKKGTELGLCLYNPKFESNKGLILGRKSKNKLIRQEG